MSSEQAKQYHSITFGDKNTWDDWHLVPSSRPVFNPPAVKTQTLEIPGADGSLDITEAFRGYPLFQNRTGSIEFYVLRGDHYKWYDVYSTVMNYLHGRRMKAILDDDIEYYYEGRFSVNQWSSDPDYSKITIDYDVEPYKYDVNSSIGDWFWDSFNFETDYIQQSVFKNISIPTNSSYTILNLGEFYFDTAPICPIFHVSSNSGSGMDFRFRNGTSDTVIENHLHDGSNQLYDVIIYGGEGASFQFKGKGIVSIEFRNGRL